MATNDNSTALAAPSTPTKRDWVNFFLPEGEAHVARRQELGDYVSDPYGAALTYAGFAAFDAMMRGGIYRNLDLHRAYRVADAMSGRTVQPERIAA